MWIKLVKWLCLCWVCQCYAGNLIAVRATSQVAHTAVVFEFDKLAPSEVTTEIPGKIQIKFVSTQLATEVATDLLQKSELLTDHIQTIQEGEDLLVTFTTKQAVTFKYFSLQNPDRLVINFYAKQLPVRHARDFLILIDPGHGGKDPGAIGASGLQEKDVVLAIAKDLQHSINQRQGFRALLTRDGDYFIGLRERLQIARKNRADMFIAIHADAFKYKSSCGASVFALSQRGATSEAARWLAEKENESELGHAIAAQDSVLRSVLLDLAQTATISASLEIGKELLANLVSITRLHKDKVEQAAFVVLKSPDIPSLLVETGFISDPLEEEKLQDRVYQQRLANALAQGICDYFTEHAGRKKV